ncbi:MAG: ABC transporter ATP-binding protein [bacterium]|nr:ABC transporter ATP-binding protein [bacterium]
MNNNISIVNLVKLFRKHKSTVRAVSGVSFDIKAGELFGLVGPNGAGKTTLIKCLSTLLIPDEGTATVGGYDILMFPFEVRKNIGVLTGGERSLYWKLTPIDNLRYFGTLYGVPKNELAHRIDYLLELMELVSNANERVERLSQGMKQKLSFARTLIHDPPILLVDEPTLGLDPSFARFIRSFIKNELNKKLKKTILLTTHYMEEADELCDRVAFMNDGKIKAIDTPQNLKDMITHEKIIELKCMGNIDSNTVPGASIFHSDGFTFLRMPSADPESCLSSLIDKIRNSAKVLRVEVTNPTLEDVFVYLTGRGLK